MLCVFVFIVISKTSALGCSIDHENNVWPLIFVWIMRSFILSDSYVSLNSTFSSRNLEYPCFMGQTICNDNRLCTHTSFVHSEFRSKAELHIFFFLIYCDLWRLIKHSIQALILTTEPLNVTFYFETGLLQCLKRS